MIGEFKLTVDHVRFEKNAKDWEEAVQIAASTLLNEGYIKQSYVDGMIESVKAHGPYIVIAPNIALPHARPETGSVKIGFNVTRFDEPVSFTEDGNNDASLFISLSCVDSNTHLTMLQEIVMILSDQDKQDKIFAAETKEEIVEIFNQ